jgi:hypothetical protein
VPETAELATGLVLLIDRDEYALAIENPPPPSCRFSGTLTTRGGLRTYTVAHRVGGLPSCTCKDFEVRHAGRLDDGCKHIRGLRKVGLLGETGLAGQEAGHAEAATAG